MTRTESDPAGPSESLRSVSIFGRPWVAPALSFVIASVALVCAIWLWGPTREIDRGDPEQYIGIGRSLASGHGYKDPVGLWPDLPAYDRMPGFPIVIAAALKLAPRAVPDAADRFAGAFCLALAAAFFTIIQRRLGVNPKLAIVGGLAVALSPGMVAMAMAGYSEPPFLALLSGAIAAILYGGRRHYIGAVLLGLTPLVRTNFVLVPFFLLLLLLLFPLARRQLKAAGYLRLAIVLCIATAPTVLWAVRNYPLTGRFPVLSSLEGEALWGSNNPVVANDLMYWGYWIMPDHIPGETTKSDLARGRTDLQLSDYYHAQAVTWIKANVRDLPRFILGKLVRGFVPIPWIPVVGTWVAFSYRFLLDFLYLVLARWWWPSVSRLYLLFCLAALMVNLTTVVMFYGSFRFTHCAVEVFYIPCIALGFQNRRADLKSRQLPVAAPC
jgi:hypothetical protein